VTACQQAANLLPVGETARGDRKNGSCACIVPVMPVNSQRHPVGSTLFSDEWSGLVLKWPMGAEPEQSCDHGADGARSATAFGTMGTYSGCRVDPAAVMKLVDWEEKKIVP
jgi:hypothetical protein